MRATARSASCEQCPFLAFHESNPVTKHGARILRTLDDEAISIR